MNTSEVLRNEDAMATVKHVMSEVIQASNAYDHDFDLEEQMDAMISRTEATAINYKPSM
jgi:2-dehydropantoate 2-reductase